MKNLKKKKDYIDQLQQKAEKAKVLILTNCEGITVEQMTAIRKDIRGLGDEMRVVKNNLFARAMNNMGKESFGKLMVGATAVTFGYSDPTSPVKALFQFASKAAKFKFKGGLLGDKELSVKDLEALSKLPNRHQLLGIVASTMIAPIRNLVSVTQGPIRKFVYALDAIRQKKEKGADS